MSYAFIAAHSAEYPVRRMCEVLKVSASGYYDWLKRVPSQREQANQRLLEAIREEYVTSRQPYGSPRVHAALQQRGLRLAASSLSTSRSGTIASASTRRWAT